MNSDDQRNPFSGLEWLERIGGIVGGLTVVAGALAWAVGFLFPDYRDNAQFLATLGAVLIAAGGFAFLLYRRRRARRFKIAPSSVPTEASAALRGLLPFEEGDHLPGRGHDVQQLFTLATSRNFHFGVLWGQSGSGKTSVLRAGLLPALKRQGHLAVYVPRPTQEPQTAIRGALVKEFPELAAKGMEPLETLLEASTPRGKRGIIILDQFEEFFLLNRAAEPRTIFAEWLGKIVSAADSRVGVLVNIRSDSFAQLQSLAPAIPEPTSPRTTYELHNFTTTQAKQVFDEAVRADDVPFEAELIDAIVSDLEVEGYVRPAELQILGTRLKSKSIYTLNRYEAEGRAQGILSSYVGEEIKYSPNQNLARLVLRLMLAEPVEAKSPRDLSLNDIVKSLEGPESQGSTAQDAQPETVQKILNQFVDARIVTHTDEDKYNLVHDYLARYVRTATQGSETNVERANRWLKRYVAEFKEDQHTRIPFGRVRFIRKYATGELRHGEAARELLGKSARAFYLRTAGIAAAILVPLLALFAYLGSSYYLAVQESGGYSFIVVRSGSPQLKGVPGFNEIVTQNDFILADVSKDSKTRSEVQRERLTGFWFDRSPSGYAQWGDLILTRLLPAAQGRGWGWLGLPERGVQVLVQAITDPTTENAARADAIRSLGLVVSNNPQVATPDLVQEMLQVMRDASAGSAARAGAANVLGDLGQANPQLVTPEVVQAAMNVVQDETVNSDLRKDQALAVGQMIEANPRVAAPDIVSNLQQIDASANADTKLRIAITEALGRIGRVASALITPQVINTANALLTDPQTDPNLSLEAGRALRRVGQAKPDALSPQTLAALVDFSLRPDLSDTLRADVFDEVNLMAQAQPANVTDALSNRLGSVVKNQKMDSLTRAAAANALGELASARPGIATRATLEMLLALVKDDQVNSGLRANAALAAGLLVRANSDLGTDKVGQQLFAEFKDTKSANELRGGAILGLGYAVHGQPKLMNIAWLQPMLETLNDVQSDGGLRVAIGRALAELAPYAAEALTQQRNTIYNSASVRKARGPLIVALAEANYAASKGATAIDPSPLLQALTDPLDSRGRLIAAHVLFFLTFDHPEQMSPVREQVSQLRNSTRPEVRVASSKALEMLTIASLYQQARGNLEQRPQILARLGALQDTDEDNITFAAKYVEDALLAAGQP